MISAFQSPYGGQFTLSTPLINQIFNDCTTASVSRACSASTTIKMIGSRFHDSVFVILLSRINIVVNSDKNLVDGGRSTAFNT